MKIAFIYDRVNKIGGAERVLDCLHQIWPDAPLYTSLYYPPGAPWAKEFKVVESFLGRIPWFRTRHEFLPLLMPYAFESFDLSSYDVIISVTSAESKGVLTKPSQLHICYLLTPTRYLWSHSAEYALQGIKGFFLKLFLNYMRKWDLSASYRPDKIISISKLVDHRCKTYYHRESDAIIYPPANLSLSAKHLSKCFKVEPNYFLVVSRLVPYKRVELAIEACNLLGEKLIIVGTGSEIGRLRQLAGPTIEFKGQISDAELSCLYQHAKALIFPQEEEFGIVAVEAQAAGLPVVAYDAGSARELIIPGKTGILFKEQTTKSLVEALNLLKNHTWYDKTIKEHTKQFSSEVFMVYGLWLMVYG